MKTPLRIIILLINFGCLTLTDFTFAADTRFEGGIAVDGFGNVYVTGGSFGSGSGTDFATVKYNSSGTQQWVSRYNGPGGNEDVPYAIAVDGSGNVYVTGGSFGSGSGLDFATVKYNSNGVQQWVRRYNGPANSDDVAYAIAIDGSGNVYVTGSSRGTGTALDYATVKYNSSGTRQWVSRYNGPANMDDIAYSIAVDCAGNVYVTGGSTGAGSGFDYATVKYNSSGTQQWASRYNGPANSNDTAYSVAVDCCGNVYVTGGATGLGSGSNYATVKYSSSGWQQWVSTYNGPANSDDVAYALAIDGVENVYVTGASFGSGSGYDYATLKYDSSGSEQWASRYNGPANSHDIAYALVVDISGAVYVTGGSTGSGTAFDHLTIKYDPNGGQLWASRYNGPDSGNDMANSLAIDGSGNVYVTGSSFGWSSGLDFATVKYNSGGSELWVSRYNGPGNGDDISGMFDLRRSRRFAFIPRASFVDLSEALVF